jgi:V8-like Glu-specific endopeptidase
MLLILGGACSSSPSSAAPSATPGLSGVTAHKFSGSPTVGALFWPGFYPGLHVCTASVVRSSGHNVIMTAAHCMEGGSSGKGYTFVPGYHDGHAPHGVWTTTAAFASPKWIKHDGDTRRDFAFLTVAARTINGRRQKLQDVVGGNRLGLGPTANETVRQTGYPLGVFGKPITCVSHVYFHQGYPASNCHGFADGTSGGPWVAGHGRASTVVGLISGLHQGGCTPATSYSSPLGKPAMAALNRAEHHRHPDTFPPMPGDGC